MTGTALHGRGLRIGPDLNQLRTHAGPETHAALSVELVADTETPISLFRKLAADRPGAFLLESVEGGELLGRYSFLGCDLVDRLESLDGHTLLRTTRGDEAQAGTLLGVLRGWLGQRSVLPRPDLPRFQGGAVGYVGFDAVRGFEPVPLPDAPGLGLPEARLLLCEDLCIFDHLKHRIVLVTHVPLAGDRTAAWQAGAARLQGLVDRLDRELPPERLARLQPHESTEELVQGLEVTANRSREDLMQAVEQAREAITAGEVFQVVVSRRFTVQGALPPFEVYRALRSLNPSPYMFYFQFADFCVAGASPEVLVRLEADELLVRPIAGTRKRGATHEQDLAFERDLLGDEKELAEHRMLVDLGRNDLGRVAALGTVRVEDPLHIERFSHVMHLVTDVRAQLAPGFDACDVLQACFPAGTVSGAPKVRACELLATLEPDRRGLYAGAVGWFGWQGDMDTCIAIRTVVLEPGRAHVQAGAGVVFDSVPAHEADECWNKARAGLAAIALTKERVRRAQAWMTGGAA
jgi:anthranilate synthase component 1